MAPAGTIVVELAGAPEGKGRPRFRAFASKGGRAFASAYTPAKTRKYEDALRFAAQQAMKGRAPLDGALDVIVYAHMPVPASWSRKKRAAALRGEIYPVTKPDWENIAKTLDAFNEVVWRDDRQVVDGRVLKRYSDRPRLEIHVRAMAARAVDLPFLPPAEKEVA